MKICLCGCGQTFEPDKYHPYQRYASRKCESRHYYKENREHLATGIRRYREQHKEERKTQKAAYYEEHKEQYKAQKAAYYQAHKEEYTQGFKKRRDKMGRYIRAIIAGSHCVRCGLNDPRVMVSHHRNSQEKERPISRMWSYSRGRVDEEIAKCEILCANCHMIIHSEKEQSS